jgi:hypothetical protein
MRLSLPGLVCLTLMASTGRVEAAAEKPVLAVLPCECSEGNKDIEALNGCLSEWIVDNRRSASIEARKYY